MGRQTGKWTLHGQTCACTRSDKCKSGLSVHTWAVWGCLGSLGLGSSWEKKGKKKKKKGIKMGNKNKVKLRMCAVVVARAGGQGRCSPAGTGDPSSAGATASAGCRHRGTPQFFLPPPGTQNTPAALVARGASPLRSRCRVTDTRSAVIVHL